MANAPTRTVHSNTSKDRKTSSRRMNRSPKRVGNPRRTSRTPTPSAPSVVGDIRMISVHSKAYATIVTSLVTRPPSAGRRRPRTRPSDLKDPRRQTQDWPLLSRSVWLPWTMMAPLRGAFIDGVWRLRGGETGPSQPFVLCWGE